MRHLRTTLTYLLQHLDLLVMVDVPLRHLLLGQLLRLLNLETSLSDLKAQTIIGLPDKKVCIVRKQNGSISLRV